MAGGSISRQVEACNVPQAEEDKCLLADGTDVGEEKFSITLNGVSSRLIHVEGDEFRLQQDPMWRVHRRYDGSHGYAFGESWEVTTPDGTRWLFGTDAVSARSVPVYYARQVVDRPCDNRYAICDVVYQWDLRRVVDTSGNVMDFDYLQETNHYNARGLEQRRYVRNSALTEITYGAFDPDETDGPDSGGKIEAAEANARVKLNWELRCKDWGLLSDCEFPNDFLDTPADRWCPQPDSSCSDKLAPTFWSQLRLGSVQTQVKQTDGSWLTDSAHDLIQYFPEAVDDPDGDENQPKMVLAQIVQRPNGVGDEAWRHYGLSPVMADRYDTIHTKGGEVTDTAGDIGFDTGVDKLGGGDRITYQDVWLGGTDDGEAAATQFSIRYATRSGGAVNILLDGKPKGRINLPSTGSMTEFNTVSTDIEIDAAIADVELEFTGGPLSDRITWFQFSLPADQVDQLPGLPPVSYVDTTEPNESAFAWLPNRVNAPIGVPDMRLPRIQTIENELGGIVEFTYGQTKPCPKNTTIDFYVEQYDCYGGLFGGDGPGATQTVLWEKWKVTETNLTPGADQPAINTRYEYVGDPQWAHRELGIDECTGFFDDWRGHNIVRSIDANGTTEYRFFTGMDDAGSKCPAADGLWSNTPVSTRNGNRQFDNPRILHGQQYETSYIDPDGTVIEHQLTLFDQDRDTYQQNNERGIFITAGTGQDAARHIAPWRTETTSTGTPDRTSAIEYRYDRYGNTITEIQLGDTNTDEDDRRAETEYTINDDKWIVSTPCLEQLLDRDGTVYRKSRLGYDSDRNQDPDRTCSEPPERGLATSIWAYTTETEASQVSTVYNHRGSLISQTDPNGNQTTLHNDPLHARVQQEINPLGWTTNYDYDQLGRQTAVTDVNGNKTEMAYDNYDRLIAVKQPSNTSDEPNYKFDYNDTQRPVSVTTKELFDLTQQQDERYLTEIAYLDGLGRQIQSQQAAQIPGNRWITASQYDATGLLTRQSTRFELSGEPDPSSYIAPDWSTIPRHHQYTYDSRGKVTQDRTIGRAEGQPKTDWDVDHIYNGWTIQTYDETVDFGVRTDYEYDAFGNLAVVIEYDGTGIPAPEYGRTTYSYDPADQMTTSSDAGGNITRYTYDLQGRQTNIDDPSLGNWEHHYDPNGNLIRQRDARQQWLEFSYDRVDRLVRRQAIDQDRGSTRNLAEYVYDHPATGLDRLHKATSFTVEGPLHKVYTQYDPDGRVLKMQTVVPGRNGGTFSQRFMYGPAGQRIAIQHPADSADSLGETITTNYNKRTGDPTGLHSTRHGQVVSNTTYGSDGRPRVRDSLLGDLHVVEEWSTDPRTDRLTHHGARIVSEPAAFYDLTYGYDNRGSVASITDHITDTVDCFQYDNLSRLKASYTTRTGCVDNIPFKVVEYSYDLIHNILGRSDYGEYSYDSDAPYQVRRLGPDVEYLYDENGNQIQRLTPTTRESRTFDVENRLAEITSSTDASTSNPHDALELVERYLYDANHQRSVRVSDNATTVHIGKEVEWTTVGVGTSVTVNYYLGGTRVAVSDEGALSLLFNDHLGSPDTWLNQTGDVERVSYSPWGEMKEGAEPPGRVSYTGQIGISNSTLLDYQSRFYDPELSRFISPDTVIPDISRPAALNRYAYVYNSPPNLVDPTGNLPGRGCGPLQFACDILDRAERSGVPVDKLPSNEKDLSLGLFRFFVFDERPCTSIVVKGCAFEVAAATPWGRVAKWGKRIQKGAEGLEAASDAGKALSGAGVVSRKGKMTVLGKAKQTELDYADILTDRGFDVTVRGTDAAGADLLVNGIEYELKTLVSATENAVVRNVKRGLSQSDKVVINGTPAGLSHADALRALERLEGLGVLANASEIVIETRSGRVVWEP